MDTGLTLASLHRLLVTRALQPGAIFHSNRGAQYASNAFRDLLATHAFKRSMSCKGDCWDNAVAESFLATLKVEAVHGVTFRTPAEAKQAISEYIESFYNAWRKHSYLGYVSPIEFEQNNLPLTRAA